MNEPVFILRKVLISVQTGHRQRKSSSSSFDNSFPGLEVEVLCIDDGNRERLPLNRLRALDENLAVVPCQALCCALAGVKPLLQNAVKLQGKDACAKQ